MFCEYDNRVGLQAELMPLFQVACFLSMTTNWIYWWTRAGLLRLPKPGLQAMETIEQKIIRLVIVDDHEVVRAGLRVVLKPFHQLEIIGEAHSAESAVQEVQRRQPDVILMDVRMPGGSGFDATREIRKQNPEARILFLTAFDDDEVLFQAIACGANGFLLKDTPVADVVSAIENIMAGRSVIDPAVTARVLGRIKSGAEPSLPSRMEQLSPQEKRILALVAKGKTNKEIGLEMGLSDKTVKNYLGNAMEKLQVVRRAQAAAYFVEHHRQAHPPTT